MTDPSVPSAWISSMLLRATSLAVALVIGLALGRLPSHRRNRKATNYSDRFSANSL